MADLWGREPPSAPGAPPQSRAGAGTPAEIRQQGGEAQGGAVLQVGSDRLQAGGEPGGPSAGGHRARGGSAWPSRGGTAPRP